MGINATRAFAEARQHLIRKLRAAGIRDAAILSHLNRLPRENFVPEKVRDRAYWDRALLAEGGQTISQPFVVARMTELLEIHPGDRVLEIGTGTGYQTALLVCLGAEVFTVERDPDLSAGAAARLEDLDLAGVTFHVGDGSGGWPAHAPYDGILVTAAVPSVPRPLVEQLGDGGRLVVPVGDRDTQTLERIRRNGSHLATERHFGCRFVPLVGEFGWK